MKEFTFIACCNYGAGHSEESCVDVELTDEEAEELLKYGSQAEIYYNSFFKCEELKALYKKVYDIAIKQMTEELKEWGDLDDKYVNDPNWKVDDLYSCEVDFPKEFEDMLPEEEK